MKWKRGKKQYLVVKIERWNKAGVNAISSSQIGLDQWRQKQEYLGVVLLLELSCAGRRMGVQEVMRPNLVERGRRVLDNMHKGKLEQCLMITSCHNCGR